MPERRTVPRKKVSVYMRIKDDDTQEILGHMVEVSAIGLRLETVTAQELERDYYLRLELTPDLGDVPYIVFIARAKWCRMDDIQPNLFHVGFKIVEVMPEDMLVFERILQKYGS